MQKIRKILRAVSEKTNQPTIQLLSTTPTYHLADAGPKMKIIKTRIYERHIRVWLIKEWKYIWLAS